MPFTLEFSFLSEPEQNTKFYIKIHSFVEIDEKNNNHKKKNTLSVLHKKKTSYHEQTGVTI